MFEDKERWNARFKARPDTMPLAPSFIQESIDSLKPGTVLDVASGDGAAALFLAAKGFDTSAMDISEVALKRLTTFATESDLDIKTIVSDLDEISQISDEEIIFDEHFDNIVIAHFKPKPEYWPHLVSWLKPRGKLLITTFNVRHHFENKFSRRFCLEEGELLKINEQLAVEHYESVERNGDFMDDYLFVKKLPQ